MTKCPECGFEIPDGQMYCSGCGWEVKLVPEFEPEIENRIDKTLSKLAGKIEDAEREEPRPQEKKPVSGKEGSVKKRTAKPRVSVLPFVIAAAVVLLAVLMFSVLHKSPDEYRTLAGREAARGNAQTAVRYLDKAIEKEPKNAENLLLKARYQYDPGNDTEAAAATLYEIINSAAFADADVEEAYRLCAEMYRETGNDTALLALLENCPYTELKALYAAYLPEETDTEGEDGNEPEPEPEPVQPPVVMEDSGLYTEPTKIIVSAGKDCTIHYTTDEGETPDRMSPEYTGPLDMPDGESVFCFVACDGDGRCSDVVVRYYTLEAEAAISPEQAVLNVKRALMGAGYMIDPDGHVSGMDGYLAYSVDSTVTIGNDGSFYYIREIHVHDDGSQEDTGRLYAVHTDSGLTTRLGYDSFGKIMIIHF